MTLYMITLTSTLPTADIASVPTSAAILAALKDVPAQLNAQSPGAEPAKWFGPKPRITRVQGEGGVVTTVQWPLETANDSVFNEGLTAAISSMSRVHLADAQRSLGTVKDEYTDFDAAKFGAQQDWASGQAQSTLTADQPAQPGQTQDDPVRPGQTMTSPTPTNYKTLALAGLAVLAVGAAVYYGGKDDRRGSRSMSRR